MISSCRNKGFSSRMCYHCEISQLWLVVSPFLVKGQIGRSAISFDPRLFVISLTVLLT